MFHRGKEILATTSGTTMVIGIDVDSGRNAFDRILTDVVQ